MLFNYIGPSLTGGTLVLVLLIGGIVVAALGYIVWIKIKQIFKKK